ncbi:MAG: DoxX family protein [Bacteroidales bacterium]|nr:DoxX family protein [Bacteroidales bacterium]
MERTADQLPWWQKSLVWVLRFIIGGVFIMSGFVKMVDPWGFLFKLEEYLAVWDIWQPRTVVLIAVLLISGYEFVMGMLLALGCYKRVAVWGLTLMMAFMLPLTLYIWIYDPVSDCGCFGDFWVLSNAATFWKNVLIASGLGVLLCLNPRVRQSFFQPAIQWIVGAWISLYIVVIGLYGYTIQPLVDFRSFPVGTALTEVSDADAEDDDEYVFVYEKDGETRDFPLSELPDSTWTFVDRRPANGKGSVSAAQFAIYDGDEDVTDEVIAAEGDEILLVIPEPVRADISYTFTVNEMYEYADSVGIPMIALLGGDSRAVERWRDVAMAEYPCYTVDDTQLKELSRGSMSVVTLRDGIVSSKNSLENIYPPAIEAPEDIFDFWFEIEGGDPGKNLIGLNLFFGGGLLLIYLFQGIILGIRLWIRKWIALRRKKVENTVEKESDVIGEE